MTREPSTDSDGSEFITRPREPARRPRRGARRVSSRAPAGLHGARSHGSLVQSARFGAAIRVRRARGWPLAAARDAVIWLDTPRAAP
jgi:hypothetical protein